MSAMSPQLEQARQELEEALLERDAAQERFDAAVGTSTEMGAYVRVRNATRRVAVADEVLRAFAEERPVPVGA